MYNYIVKKLDFTLFFTILAILSLGLATFFAMGPLAHLVFVRHAIFIGVGIVVMSAFATIDYRIFKNYSAPSLVLYAFATILLGLALASREIRGSSAWLQFFGFQFEPSEFAKLALTVVLAKYFSQKHVEIYRAHHLIVSGIYVAIPLGLTLLQPDLGSVIVYAALWIVILLAAGIKRHHLLAIGMIGVIAASVGWFLVLKSYQKDRIVSFVNPYADPRGSGYNTIQSRITVGSGKWIGTAFTGRSETTPALVPEPYTDFTFAAFAQKFGFVGVAALAALFTVLMARLGAIGARADNNFAKLFTLGFMMILLTHIAINGGMNLGLLPITGIPFPLLSHGGSHLVILMAGFGLMQSIYRGTHTR